MRLVCPDGSVFERSWQMFGAVIADATVVSVDPYKVEVSMQVSRSLMM